MSWVVQDEVCGRVVVAGDSASLAAALRDFVDNRDNMRHLGTRGRQRFLDHFDIDCIAPNISRLYTELLRRAEPSL